MFFRRQVCPGVRSIKIATGGRTFFLLPYHSRAGRILKDLKEILLQSAFLDPGKITGRDLERWLEHYDHAMLSMHDVLVYYPPPVQWRFLGTKLLLKEIFLFLGSSPMKEGTLSGFITVEGGFALLHAPVSYRERFKKRHRISLNEYPETLRPDEQAG